MGIDRYDGPQLRGALKLAKQANYEEQRLIGVRECLRAVEWVGDKFDFKRSGWAHYSYIQFLRLVHILSISIEIDDRRLRHSFNSAAKELGQGLLDDESRKLRAALELAGTLPPRERSGKQNDQDRFLKLLLMIHFDPEAHLAGKWEAAFVSDCEACETLNFGQPLFANLLPSTDSRAIPALRANANLSTYWSDWYKSLLIGKPLSAELNLEIATIDQNDWVKGDAHVARLIDGIRCRYDLRSQVSDLRVQLEKVSGDPPPMGHNMPPEMIEEASPQQAMTIIWATIGELEEELDRDTPDQGRLEGLQKRIAALAAKAGNFAKDVAYDNAKVGATGVIAGAVGANWTNIQSILTSISTTVLDWIAYIIWLAI